jgi:hypothetical protein
VPEHQPEQFHACAVCGRTILRGERMVDYLTPEGERLGVCTLCRDRAEAAGWVRADSAAAYSQSTEPRRRRGLTAARLRERVAQLGAQVKVERRERAERSADAEDEQPPPGRPPAPPPREEAEPDPDPPPPPDPPPEPDTPERRLRRAIASFNSSEQSRVVAGLIRSLGEPRVALHDVSARPPRAEVTVAWELSWYRWEVAPNGEGGAVRETAKGDEVSELDDVEWNASVDPDGKLRWPESS